MVVGKDCHRNLPLFTKNKAENAIQPEDDEGDWLFLQRPVLITNTEIPGKNNRNYFKALPKIADKIINFLRLQYISYLY